MFFEDFFLRSLIGLVSTTWSIQIFVLLYVISKWISKLLIRLWDRRIACKQIELVEDSAKRDEARKSLAIALIESKF
jgi:hypothetical protein